MRPASRRRSVDETLLLTGDAMSGESWNEYWYDWVWPADIDSAESLARKVLGVGPSANMKEIKQAYRSLARQLHPDTNPSDGTLSDRFKVIAEAYEILTSDRNKRTRRLANLKSCEDKTIYQPYPEWWITRFKDMF